jgi:hypothetical protein
MPAPPRLPWLLLLRTSTETCFRQCQFRIQDGTHTHGAEAKTVFLSSEETVLLCFLHPINPFGSGPVLEMTQKLHSRLPTVGVMLLQGAHPPRTVAEETKSSLPFPLFFLKSNLTL